MMEGKISKDSTKRRSRLEYLQGVEANPSPGQMSGINHPGMHDVMFGRGGDTNYHIGNNSFRHLIETYREKYWAASNRKEKSQIIAAIVKGWRTQDPPGRFLIKTDPAKGDESLWHDVGDQVAGRKASKILSEMRIGKKKKAMAAAKASASAASAAASGLEEGRESPQQRQRRQQQQQAAIETDSPEYISKALTNAMVESKTTDSPVYISNSLTNFMTGGGGNVGFPRLSSPGPAIRALSSSTTSALRETPDDLPAPTYSDLGAVSFLRPPEDNTTNITGMGMMLPLLSESSATLLARQHQQQHQHQHQQQLEPNDPSLAIPPVQVPSSLRLGSTMPTAAALTEVFQDQFVTNDRIGMVQPNYSSRGFFDNPNEDGDDDELPF